MIGKGNFHAHGVKLAAYLVAGHRGERAELIEMRGFGPVSDLREGFRIEHIRARDGTKADQPFFHVQFRGAHGEGLQLTLAQQLEIADRCDKALGLAGQPRAASLHINRQTGDAHLHLGYSLVAEGEDGRLFVKKLGLYKNKLKRLSREIERDYGLKIVSSERQPGQAPAADRKELEQSRRLGTDGPAIRATILDALEKSDGGRAFKAALDAQGLMLANGDRRDCFVVIDQTGGHHALNKGLTGQTLAATRDRLADLDRSQLPGVEQAQAMQAERHHAHEAAQEAHQRPEPQPGAEARPGQERAADGPEKRPLGKTAAQIHAAWDATRNPMDIAASAAAFVEAIEERGPILVYVSADEAKASERARSFAKAVDRQSRALREGFAVVDERGTVTHIDQRTTGDFWQEIEQRLASIDRAGLLTVAAARDVMKEANKAAWATEQQTEREQARAPSVIEARIVECAEQARLSGATIIRDGTGRRMTGADALADRLRPDGEGVGATVTVRGPEAFAARLEEAGITLARVTDADMLALAALRQDEERGRQAADTNFEARKAHRFAELVPGELAAVTRGGDVHRINPDKLRGVEFAAALPSVTEARAVIEIEIERKAELWTERQTESAAARAGRAEAFEERQQLRRTVRTAERTVEENLRTGATAVERGFKAATALLSGTAKLAEAAIGFLSDLFAPTAPPTREEAQGMQRAAEQRHTEAADMADAADRAARLDDLLSQIARDDAEQLRQSRERGGAGGDRPAERDDDYGRERDR
jgi:hypothetical protein